MAMEFHLDIVSAEAEIFSGAATMLFAPAQMGEIGVAPRHAPLMTFLKPGECRVRKRDGSEEAFFVSGGMIEVLPHVVTVLADTALRGEDIDEEAAREAKRHAEAVLKGQSEELSPEQAHAQLAEALAKLQVVEQMKQLKHGRFK